MQGLKTIIRHKLANITHPSTNNKKKKKGERKAKYRKARSREKSSTTVSCQ